MCGSSQTERKVSDFPPGTSAYEQAAISAPRAVRKPRGLVSKPGFEGKVSENRGEGNGTGTRKANDCVGYGTSSRMAWRVAGAEGGTLGGRVSLPRTVQTVKFVKDSYESAHESFPLREGLVTRMTLVHVI